MKSILPQYVTIKLDDMYRAIVEFLDKYSRDIQSKDMQNLVVNMKNECNERMYLLWIKELQQQLIEANVLKNGEELPKSITIDTYDIYMSVIRFLEVYNKEVRSEDVLLLASALGQFHLAQWVYKDWENALKLILIERGEAKNTELHN